ncbi:MAG: phospholipid methyltransferase [Acidobacteria bacterium RIFCSPLOWO2_02_FULL_65_29]|nr:MAG: phospholipid methyltransferase [Acidobacteria bacterium RIFCSPLOWO2_02_FULL_65_29]
MAFYDKWVLPRLIDLAMRNKEATRYRSRIVPQANGVVLEVGVGSGLNLPFYGTGVARLYGLDPSEELLRMAREKARATAFPVDFLARSGEEIPLDDGSIDTVVMTWTLCSIPDPVKAMKEMKRVLKPGGTLLFAEHGLAPDARVRIWQDRLNPLWGRIAGGCNLNRKMDELIRTSGFRIVELESEYAKGPRPMSYVYSGRAQPAVATS